MAAVKLPNLKVAEVNDVKELMKLVKPDWPSELIQIKKMTGGYSCSSYHCYLPTKPQEGLSVRAQVLFFGVNFPFIIPGFEYKTVELISKLGIFPRLFAIFQNGYCYQHIQGKVLINFSEAKDQNVDDCPYYQERILKSIAEKLVAIHSLKMEGEDYSKSEMLERLMKTHLQFYPELPDIPNKTTLEVELKEIMKYVERMQPEVVFCHGDPHPGNIIWNEDSKEMTFIDWELAHIGYQALDVAYFLESYNFLAHKLGCYCITYLLRNYYHLVSANYSGKEINVTLSC